MLSGIFPYLLLRRLFSPGTSTAPSSTPSEASAPVRSHSILVGRQVIKKPVFPHFSYSVLRIFRKLIFKFTNIYITLISFISLLHHNLSNFCMWKSKKSRSYLSFVRRNLVLLKETSLLSTFLGLHVWFSNLDFSVYHFFTLQLCFNCVLIYTVCPRSSAPFYVLTYNMKWVTTSCTYIV